MGGAYNSPHYNWETVYRYKSSKGMPTHLKVIVIVRLVSHGTAHCPAKKNWDKSKALVK